MPTPYEAEARVTTTEADEVVAVDFPSRATIRRLATVNEADDQHLVNVYNRLFDGPDVDIQTIIDDGDTKCLIETDGALLVKVNDSITVAGSSVGGYDATHVITAVNVETVLGRKRYRYVTDQTYTDDATGGTATLAIPAEQQHLNQVMSQQQSDGTGQLLYFPGDAAAGDGNIYFVNSDPANPDKEGRKTRKIYLKLDTAGTYRIHITAAIETTDD